MQCRRTTLITDFWQQCATFQTIVCVCVAMCVRVCTHVCILNQTCNSHKVPCVWFLTIIYVHEDSMCVCTCVWVSFTRLTTKVNTALTIHFIRGCVSTLEWCEAMFMKPSGSTHRERFKRKLIILQQILTIHTIQHIVKYL